MIGRTSERRRGRWVILAAVVLSLYPTGASRGDDDDDEEASDRGTCSSTARLALHACEREAQADYLLALGKCINVEDAAAQGDCAEARAAREESMTACRDQREVRREVCAALGEGRYDPAIDPADFDSDYTNLTHPNPYFPLAIGNRWVFGGDEDIVIEVLDKTKLIEAVTCIVVNDRVLVDGGLVEDTDDWFAQARSGDVYYFGEEVKDYETFEGDEPREPELVAIDGSFKAGREGDKPGLAFLAMPAVGQTYRQEFSLNNAEDVARILSTSYAFGDDANLDQFVPQELAEALCEGDCVVVEEFSPLDPGPDGVGRKYYASGIGFFLEIVPESGEVVQLVACNFDPRCEALPEPE